MYEIWSLGHKPFEDCKGKEVIVINCNTIATVYLCSYIATYVQTFSLEVMDVYSWLSY